MENNYKKQRKWIRITHPKDQFILMLPNIVVIVFVLAIAGTISWHIKNYAALTRVAHHLNQEVLEQYLLDTEFYLYTFAIATILLVLIGFLWSLLMSFRIFGPLRRLKRELLEIKEGKRSPSDLKVREGDTFEDIVQIIQDVLVGFKK